MIENGLIRLVSTRISGPDIEILQGYLPNLRSQARLGADGWHGFLNIEVDLRKELIRISRSLLYKAVLIPVHENIFSYAAPCISGEDANVKEALDDWIQIGNALANGDTNRAVNYTRDHIKRYACRMKQGMAKTRKVDSRSPAAVIQQ